MARQLGKLSGVTMNRIPFRGGLQVVQELLAGRVDLYPSPTLAIISQYRAKQLKILATTSPQRLRNLPEIPTLREAGFDFVRFGWLGICAGTGTPQPIIRTLNAHIVPIVESPDYRALIENAGSIAQSSSPEELGAIMQKTLEEVAPAIKEYGLQQD
jgi:tripartite-type tricarboxylate transporter receptor subunit TctC